MKNNYVRNLFVPLLSMVLLLLLILVEQHGFMGEARAPILNYLPEEASAETVLEAPQTLILYSSQKEADLKFAEQLSFVLSSIDIAYRTVDLATEELGSLEGKTNLYYCDDDLDLLLPAIESLSTWIECGGHFGLMRMPAYSRTFRLFSGKLGIIETPGEYELFTSIRFLTDLLPLYSEGTVYDEASLQDYTLAVRLSGDCTVHMETGDDRHIPLLWDKDLGQGRVMVFNGDLLGEKSNRGFILCALMALEEKLCYPIVNAGMIFIDDFPAPQPEGTDERLLKDFGYNIQGFFRNHWWPDMKQLVYKYGVRYTGVLIETYNDTIDPPFQPDSDERALLRYYASELIHAGGEIGLHGYNHMPLCLDGFQYSNENYFTWPSVENMRLAIEELYRYAKRILPEATFNTYVPPSNYLSPEGQATLLQTVPDIRTISGLYLYETGVNSLTQEFQEEADGSISVPRITSGFAMDSFNELVCAQELVFHGVYSHFIHPDDVLDEERGASLGWTTLYQTFEDSISTMSAAYPRLRYSSASEGAAAVQRYDRMNVRRTWEDGQTLQIDIDGFVDEAWLALRTDSTAYTVNGAVVHPINDHFVWLYAKSDHVTIRWEAVQ